MARLQIIPLELTVLIAKHLTNPKDLENLLKVFPHLDPLLLPILKESIEDKFHEPALSWASYNGDVDLVTRLLKIGVDVNARQPGNDALGSKYTALHRAAINGKTAVMKVLLDHGGKLDAQMDAVLSFLCSGTAFHCAAYWGHKQIVNFLIDAGVDINHTNSFGQTALHMAIGGACENHSGIVELLVGRGANLNAKDEDGRTALHLGMGNFLKCSAESAMEAASLLLREGAEIDIRDRWGKTALHYAAAEKGFKDVINLLLENGADASAQSHSGLTPIDTIIVNRYNIRLTGKRPKKGKPVNKMEVI